MNRTPFAILRAALPCTNLSVEVKNYMPSARLFRRFRLRTGIASIAVLLLWVQIGRAQAEDPADPARPDR